MLERNQLQADGYVLAVGNLAAQKNLQGLREAADRLAKLGMLLALVGGFERSVFSTSQDLISSNAKYVGRVEDSELHALYENAACFACPSFYEGFGFPATEAMACGCPVVSANIASLRETCVSAAICVESANSHEIADAVETAINDKAGRARFKREMIDEAGRHLWDAAALRLATALKTNRA